MTVECAHVTAVDSLHDDEEEAILNNYNGRHVETVYESSGRPTVARPFH